MFWTPHPSEKRKLLIAAFSVTWIVEGNLFRMLVTDEACTDGYSLLPNIY